MMKKTLLHGMTLVLALVMLSGVAHAKGLLPSTELEAFMPEPPPGWTVAPDSIITRDFAPVANVASQDYVPEQDAIESEAVKLTIANSMVALLQLRNLTKNMGSDDGFFAEFENPACETIEDITTIQGKEVTQAGVDCGSGWNYVLLAPLIDKPSLGLSVTIGPYYELDTLIMFAESMDLDSLETAVFEQFLE